MMIDLSLNGVLDRISRKCIGAKIVQLLETSLDTQSYVLLILMAQGFQKVLIGQPTLNLFDAISF